MKNKNFKLRAIVMVKSIMQIRREDIWSFLDKDFLGNLKTQANTKIDLDIWNEIFLLLENSYFYENKVRIQKT